MPSLLLRLQPLRNYLSSITRPSHIYSTISSRPSSFSASPPLLKNTNLPPRPKPPPEEDIEESFLKGSGPGGQKINKTNSAVQLKHLPTGLVIKSQATRSRSQNRVIARQLLADKLDQLSRGDESRSAIVGEFKRKKKASSAKKSRRKYRKLDEEKQQAQAGTALQEEEDLEEEEFEEGGEEEEFQDSSRNSERIENK
ncbi:RF-1 domain-containing protein [Daldinia loculata]|uniref:RF-1 domain-containing protein n=1 Tax=Daldinia loculata TaxID=103429 RepID=UPI0020C4A255|nr:RF-1 domain-containing protein [Daldinia loculata]KAI1647205.1 RF-1 domain-containing protein [Daldinia loculata]